MKKADKLKSVEPKSYDADYFERGVQTQKSGYQNYSWLPELTLKMAHHLVTQLPLEECQKVLDFGCAKGFLVKALRILDIEAYGVDISRYAIDCVDPEVRGLCDLVTGASDPKCFSRSYDWLISKDVFEHLTEEQLIELLQLSRQSVRSIFAAVPLGKPDGSGFIIPDYDRDITHVTVQPLEWWVKLFEVNGWVVKSVQYSFRGVKDNWISAWPQGNAFFILNKK